MDSAAFAALADPTRRRIVELLGQRPRAVGEIATVLDLRQPQATKHLQALARAGLVTIHPLAQRRIYALDPKPLVELARWLDALGDGGDDSLDVLERYQRAIELESAEAARDPHWAEGRTMTLARSLPADPATVWDYWTVPDRCRTWWGPAHFTVTGCELDARPGGAIAVEIQEGDGIPYLASGTFTELDPPGRLAFALGTHGATGDVLVRARYTVDLRPAPGGTDLSLHSEITDSATDASAMVAGMRLGWQQSLAKLARAVERAS